MVVVIVGGVVVVVVVVVVVKYSRHFDVFSFIQKNVGFFLSTFMSQKLSFSIRIISEILYAHLICGPRYLSWYNKSLRTERSGDRIPVDAKFSAPVQTGNGVHLHTSGFFPEVKQPGGGVDHPPPSCDEVKERADLYMYSPLGLEGSLRDEIYRSVGHLLHGWYKTSPSHLF